jgi:hypothetical protein
MSPLRTSSHPESVTTVRRRFMRAHTHWDRTDHYQPILETELRDAPEAESDFISSLLEDDRHAPLFDLDIPARLVPSTTPGHTHLYIDHPMSWRQYKRLVRAMVRAGVVEKSWGREVIRSRMGLLRTRPGK